MDLTPAQHEKLVALWRTHTTRVAAMRAARAAVVDSLAHVEIAEVRPDNTVESPLDSMRAMVSRYLALFDSTSKMAAYQKSDNELMAVIDLMRDVGKVWSVLHRAKMVALSYPAFPDTVAFLQTVAAMTPEELARPQEERLVAGGEQLAALEGREAL